MLSGHVLEQVVVAGLWQRFWLFVRWLFVVILRFVLTVLAAHLLKCAVQLAVVNVAVAMTIQAAIWT